MFAIYKTDGENSAINIAGIRNSWKKAELYIISSNCNLSYQ